MWGAYALAVLLDRRKTPQFVAEGAYWMARSAEFRDRTARRVIVESRVPRAYAGLKERELFQYGRVLAMDAFQVPHQIWGHHCKERDAKTCEAAAGTYRFIMHSVRRAVVYWILVATRELRLIKDVAVLIGKKVFESRSEGGWWVRESPFEQLPPQLLGSIFCRLRTVGDWNALARTCVRFDWMTSFRAEGERLFDILMESFGAGRGTRSRLIAPIAQMYKVKLFRSPKAQPEEVYIAARCGMLVVTSSDWTGKRFFDAGMANERIKIMSALKAQDGPRLRFGVVGRAEELVALFDSDASRDSAGREFNAFPMLRDWFTVAPPGEFGAKQQRKEKKKR